MRYREFFIEARKNPAQNPKVSINSELYTALDLAKQSADTVAGIPNLFVTFTEIENKIGINPNTRWDEAPLGIYAYPVSYVKKTINNGNMDELLFAGDREHATIFKVKQNTNVINLAKISNSAVNKYFKKIADYWSNASKEPKTVDDVNNIISDLADEDLYSYPGWRLFQASRSICNLLNSSSLPAAWNKLFTQIGIEGLIDPGSYIISADLPCQAVIFNMSSLQIVKAVYNRKNYNAADPNKKFEKDVDIAQLKVDLMRDPKQFSNIINPSEALQLEAVPINLQVIKYIKNPSLAVQMAAVKGDPRAISYIKDPSEAVQMATVTNKISGYGEAIQYIKNPSDAVQIAAIKTRPNAFNYIKNPSPAAVKLAKQLEAKKAKQNNSLSIPKQSEHRG